MSYVFIKQRSGKDRLPTSHIGFPQGSILRPILPSPLYVVILFVYVTTAIPTPLVLALVITASSLKRKEVGVWMV